VKVERMRLSSPARPFNTLGKVCSRYSGAHTSQTWEKGAVCSFAMYVSSLVTAKSALPVAARLAVG
jgi:hypothetical protein